jgi:hypothetical protein
MGNSSPDSELHAKRTGFYDSDSRSDLKKRAPRVTTVQERLVYGVTILPTAAVIDDDVNSFRA